MSTFESDDCRRFGKRRLSNPLRHCVRASLHHIRQVRDGQCAIAPKRSAPSAERQLVSLKSYRRNQEGIHLHFPQRHRCTHFLNVSRITARSFVASTTPGSRASKAKAIGRDLKRTHGTLSIGLYRRRFASTCGNGISISASLSASWMARYRSLLMRTHSSNLSIHARS